jgi:methylase of polypeptide subunit release factors
MVQVLTVEQPRLDLECPPGIQVPGPASLGLLKYLFSIRGKSVLDLGCGAGLFAIAASKLGAAEVWAIDASRAALEVTRRNAERNRVDVVAKLGKLFEPLEGRSFDLIVARPPQLDTPQTGPELAADGLRYFESVLREAPEHLERGGELLTCFPVRDETARFESLLRERFRYRQLPETQDDRRHGFALRSYLAMKL